MYGTGAPTYFPLCIRALLFVWVIHDTLCLCVCPSGSAPSFPLSAHPGHTFAQPCVMGFSPADPKCDAFYDLAKELGMVRSSNSYRSLFFVLFAMPALLLRRLALTSGFCQGSFISFLGFLKIGFLGLQLTCWYGEILASFSSISGTYHNQLSWHALSVPPFVIISAVKRGYFFSWTFALKTARVAFMLEHLAAHQVPT